MRLTMHSTVGAPAVSMFCETHIFNVDSPNAALELRLPDNTAYFEAVKEIMVQYWNGTGDFVGLSDEEAAILASRKAAAARESVTEAGGRELAIDNYQKELGIYVAPPDDLPTSDDPFLPEWVVWIIVATLGGIICLTSLMTSVVWVIHTYRQKQKLKARQLRRWEELIDDAEASAVLLGCPMALISAEHFLECGQLLNYEELQDDGKIRVLDTLEKLKRFLHRLLLSSVACVREA